MLQTANHYWIKVVNQLTGMKVNHLWTYQNHLCLVAVSRPCNMTSTWSKLNLVIKGSSRIARTRPRVPRSRTMTAFAISTLRRSLLKERGSVSYSRKLLTVSRCATKKWKLFTERSWSSSSCLRGSAPSVSPASRPRMESSLTWKGSSRSRRRNSNRDYSARIRRSSRWRLK